MLPRSSPRCRTPRRRSAIIIESLTALVALVVSVPSIVPPECRERASHLTLDAVGVALFSVLVQLFVMVPHRRASWRLVWCVTWHHMKFAIAGGFFFGASVGVVKCLLG